jgi:hypothetical protein
LAFITPHFYLVGLVGVDEIHFFLLLRQFHYDYCQLVPKMIDHDRPSTQPNPIKSPEMDYKKEDQTGIEPVTLGPAIPRSTPELLIPVNRRGAFVQYNRNFRGMGMAVVVRWPLCVSCTVDLIYYL